MPHHTTFAAQFVVTDEQSAVIGIGSQPNAAKCATFSHPSYIPNATHVADSSSLPPANAFSIPTQPTVLFRFGNPDLVRHHKPEDPGRPRRLGALGRRVGLPLAQAAEGDADSAQGTGYAAAPAVSALPLAEPELPHTPESQGSQVMAELGCRATPMAQHPRYAAWLADPWGTMVECLGSDTVGISTLRSPTGTWITRLVVPAGLLPQNRNTSSAVSAAEGMGGAAPGIVLECGSTPETALGKATAAVLLAQLVGSSG